MKNFYAIFGTSFLLGLLLLFSAGTKYTGGSPGARTGSPGDNNTSCTQCHNGTEMTAEDWITSDIPASGYVPGETYSITLNATHASQKFGFEATAEITGGQKTGVFIITNDNETKLVNGNNAVTHKSGGTQGSNARSWSFDWVAPVEGTGRVTFYAAINATNSNNGTSGDVVYLTQLEVDEVNTQIPDIASPELALYPIPAENYVNVNIVNPGVELISLKVFSMTGKLISYKQIQPDGSTTHTERIMLQELKPGYYFLDMNIEGTSYIKKIAKL